MTDLTNVLFNHTFLATLSLTIHIQNISTILVQVYYIHHYVTHGFFQRNKITIELVASNQGKKLALVVVESLLEHSKSARYQNERK
jgi:DNA-directed RNA polymerase subunit L